MSENRYLYWLNKGIKFKFKPVQVEGEKVQLSRDELTQIMVGWAALQQPAAPPVGVSEYDESDPDQKDFALVRVEDEVALKRMMRELFTHTRFGFDVETARAEGLSDEEEGRLKTALDPYRARLRLVQIAVPGTVYVVDVWKTGQDLEWLKRLFDHAQQIISHNQEFDLRIVAARGVVMPSGVKLFCTMIADTLVTAGDRTARHSLGVVVPRWLGVGIDKGEQRSDWSRLTLTAEQIEYAARDSYILLPLADRLQEEIIQARLDRVFSLEMGALPAIATMRLEGVGFDRDSWMKLAREAEANCDEVEEALGRFLDVKVAPKSTRQMRAALLEYGHDVELNELEAACGGARFKPFKTQKALKEMLDELMIKLKKEEVVDIVKGRVNLASSDQRVELLNKIGEKCGFEVENADEDTLKALEGKHPAIPYFLRLAKATKLATTYGEEFLQYVNPVTKRLHADWRQLGTQSGRMSCGEGMQQIPGDKRYRGCFTAPDRKGKKRKLIKADYSQIELRIAAVVFRDQRMLQAYNAHEDLHRLTAALVLDKDIKDVTDADRKIAKSLNFGLLYGMGARKLRIYAKTNYGVDMTEEQAQQFREKWLLAYQGVQIAHRAVRSGVEDVRTLAGRRRIGVERYSEKLNTPIQGTGADGTKAALKRLWEDRERFPTAFPVLIVHDEIVVECDEDDAEACKEWLVNHMVAGMAEVLKGVPIEVEAQVANSWAA